MTERVIKTYTKALNSAKVQRFINKFDRGYSMKRTTKLHIRALNGVSLRCGLRRYDPDKVSITLAVAKNRETYYNSEGEGNYRVCKTCEKAYLNEPDNQQYAPLDKHPERIPIERHMVLWAMRYALGRMTYAVSMVAEEVRRVASQLSSNDRETMKRDIREALEMDQAGMDCDRREWEKTLKALEEVEEADCER